MALQRLTSVAAALEVAEDPLLLYHGSGEMSWLNQSARALFEVKPDEKPALASLIGIEAARLVLSTSHAGNFNVRIQRTSEIRSAVVLQVGTGDPDELIFLIALPVLSNADDKVREREEFLAGIAHDLKNPLSAIFGYADVCLDTELGKTLSPKQREILEKIRRTSTRSIDLIRNYQLLVQLQSGARQRPKERIDLNTVVSSVINSIWREQHDAPTLSLSLEKAPLLLLVDRVFVDRVVANLFGNAAIYTPQGGRIEVRTRREERCIILEIFNSGSFIPESERESIFERYHRGRGTEGIPGTGLGLYLVKSILNETRGSISVESKKDVGSRFIVRWETE